MTASNRGTARRWLALSIPVGVLLSAAACTVDDGPTGLEIVQGQYLDTSASTCAPPADATDTQRVAGTLDVALDTLGPYRFYPLLENFLPTLTGLTGSGTSKNSEEKNLITLNSFHVELEQIAPFSGGVPISWPEGCPKDFDTVLTGTVLWPGDTLATFVDLLQLCHAAALRELYLSRMAVPGDPTHYDVTNQAARSQADQFRATVRAKGHHGSGTISSPPFQFVVHTCFGCLQMDFGDPVAGAFDFPSLPLCDNVTSNPFPGNPCNHTQDAKILCCLPDAKQLDQVQCPAVPRAATTTP